MVSFHSFWWWFSESCHTPNSSSNFDGIFPTPTSYGETPMRNCILVAWGFETQQRLMWTKIDFVVVAP